MSVIGILEGGGGLSAGGLGTTPALGATGGLVHDAASSIGGFALNQIGAWVLHGTEGALREVASIIGAATAPNLESTWFSSTYWRVAALAAILTIPFLCAAAVQALARADMLLLGRTVFGYLPLSLLGVSLAAPLTMLLLSATDQMSAAVSAGAVTGGALFLDQAAAGAVALSASGSTFFALVVGLFTLLAALGVALELLIRAAAVYVVVLMLPLAFAALVWPARRVWSARVVELLVSLILSKFVIVAVLSLAAGAFASHAGISTLLTAMALLLLATFAPWALMRLLPFTEVAAGAAGLLRQELPRAGSHAIGAPILGGAEAASALPERLTQMSARFTGGARDDAERGTPGAGPAGPAPGPADPGPAAPGPAAPGPAALPPGPGSSSAAAQAAAPENDKGPYPLQDWMTTDTQIRLGGPKLISDAEEDE